jgi:hypothetical protein
MADISWPDSLPGLRRSGYRGSSTPRNLRTEMESGRPRVTRLSSSRMEKIPGSIIVNSEQFSEFVEFYDETTLGGTAWFDIRLDTGQEPTIHEARFIGGYNYTPLGFDSNKLRTYVLNFRLETDERNAIN